MTFGFALGTTGLLLTLGILALIDSTSIGTLVIPLLMVLRARNGKTLRAAIYYLGVLATFYLVIGLLVLSGVGFLDTVLTGGILDSSAMRWILLIVGAGMFAGSFAMNRKPKTASAQYVAADGTTKEQPHAELPDPSPATKSQLKWGNRLDRALGTRTGVAILGLSAGLLELPTMLPYLGAIGLLSTSGKPVTMQVGLLVLYCVVMIVPALLLIAVRAVAGERLTKHFDKLSAWLAKSSGETLAWVVGIIGFLLLRSSLSFLFPYAPWNPFK